MSKEHPKNLEEFYQSEEREKIEIEPSFERPWEELERKEDVEIQEKVAESFNLSKETQDSCSTFLKELTEEKKRAFAKEWFEEHIDELKERGIPVREISEEKKADIAISQGALEELKTKPEFREKYEGIEDLNTARLGLEMKRMKLETPILILHQLDKKATSLKEEVDQMKEAGEAADIISLKERKLGDLFKARKELAEKISGHDLEKEQIKVADEKILPKESEFIDGHFNEKKGKLGDRRVAESFREEWKKLPKEEKEKYDNDIVEFARGKFTELIQKITPKGGWDLVVEKSLWYFLGQGYKPEDIKFTRRPKDFFRKKIQVKEGVSLTQKEFKKLVEEESVKFDKRNEEQAKKELAEEWKKMRQDHIRKAIEIRITQIANSPEIATDNVKEMCKRLRKEILAEFIEKDLKKDEKTAEQLREIKKNFEKKGIKTTEFISDVNSRKRGLEKLSGKPEEDAKVLKEFLGDYGIGADEDYISDFIGRRKENYGKALRQEKGFLRLFFSLIIDLIFGARK